MIVVSEIVMKVESFIVAALLIFLLQTSVVVAWISNVLKTLCTLARYKVENLSLLVDSFLHQRNLSDI